MENTNDATVILSKIAEARLESAKRAARAGDPLPFIRLQWPHFVIPEGHPDQEFFETDLRLDDFQLLVLRSVFDVSVTEVMIKGATRTGKGFSTSLAVNIFFDVWEESRVILLGPSHRHGLEVMFAEISDLRKKMQYPMPGTAVQAQSIVDKNRDKHEIVVVNPSNDEGLSGRHSPKVMFVFDESSSISGSFYMNALKQSRMIVAISNPRTTSGWYRDAFGYDKPDECHRVKAGRGWRQLVTISGADCLNVKHKRLDAPYSPRGGIEIDGTFYPEGEVIPDDVHEKVHLLVPSQIDYAMFQATMSSASEFERIVFGLGRFPSEDIDKQIIFSSWLGRHRDAWREDIDVTSFGLDVAASTGGDRTVLAAGGPDGCASFHEIKTKSNNEIADWVIRTAMERYGLDLKSGRHAIAIDWTAGYGSGVGQLLRSHGVCVIECHSSTRSRWPNIYENLRAELYGELAKRLDPLGPWGPAQENSEDIGHPWALPSGNDCLFEELLAHEKVFGNDRVKWGIIPKEKPTARSNVTIKSKLGRSPDYSDALVYLWYSVSMQHDVIGAGHDRGLIAMSMDELLGGGKKETIADIANRVVESDEWGDQRWSDPLGAFW